MALTLGGKKVRLVPRKRAALGTDHLPGRYSFSSHSRHGSSEGDESDEHVNGEENVTLGSLNGAIQTLISKFNDLTVSAASEVGKLKELLAAKLVVIDTLSAKVTTLETKITILENAALREEGVSRATNVMLFNVREPPASETLQTPLHQARQAFQDAGAAIQPGELMEVTRMGRLRADNKPRPLKVRFRSSAAVAQAFKAKKQLREKGYGLDNDLGPLQLEKRRALAPAVQRLRQDGLRPFFKGTQLWYVPQSGPPLLYDPSSFPVPMDASPAAPANSPATSTAPRRP